MRLDPVEAETRRVLAGTWRGLPAGLRGPTQFLGRQYSGCGATLGVMPRCDFTCTGCYLGADANRAAPIGLDDAKAQLHLLRAWLGPGGNVQVTDGEVTLREEAELIELIRYARAIGLVPMVMTHGETFRRKAGLLERLVAQGGLTEVSFHVDVTMRGRRDGYAQAASEPALHGLRAEFAAMIRAARRATGRRLEAVSTVTVTRANLPEVPDVVQWFLRHADAFKMVSFQPLARVGRTKATLEGVTADELWAGIARGVGDPGVARGTGFLGHPACSRFVQGLVPRGPGRPRFVPLYDRDRPDDLRVLSGLLDRLGGLSFRLDDRPRAVLRAVRALARHPAFLFGRVLPRAYRLARRVGLRACYFNIVSHHFMSAGELATPEGRERLQVCAFRVPIDGELVSMCAANALGRRDAAYRATRQGAA